MEEFNADLTMSVLGLTLFVLGYGVVSGLDRLDEQN